MDERTPEQVEADANLEAALERSSRAYFPVEDGEPAYLIDWMVILVRQDPNRATVCTYDMMYPNGSIPAYRVLGMLEAAKLMMFREDAGEVD